MSTTTRLGLTKPATTDAALIGDINTNMDTVDSAIMRLEGSNTATAAFTANLAAASDTAGLKLPSKASAIPTTDGFIAFDTTTHRPVFGVNGTTQNGLLHNATNTAGSSFVLDASAASVTAGLKLPSSAGAAPTTDGFLAYDTTAKRLVVGTNSLTAKVLVDVGTNTLISTATFDASAIASEAFKVLDAVFTDESAPAAPGAGKTVLYTVSGIPFYRAGASGASTQLGGNAPTFAISETPILIVNTATTWPSANRAFYVPVLVTYTGTIAKIRVSINTQSGNIDAGLYGPTGTRLASSGSTAMAVAGAQTLTITGTAVTPGLYYIGIAVDNGTAVLTNDASAAGLIRATQVNTNFPLPASFTPAGAAAFSPWASMASA